MSALTFTLKNRPDQRVDMSPLVCQKLAGMEPAEIAAITLQNGNRKVRVYELFKISGSDVQNIVIKNSFGKLDFIGKELEGGSIVVEGDAGDLRLAVDLFEVDAKAVEEAEGVRSQRGPPR